MFPRMDEDLGAKLPKIPFHGKSASVPNGHLSDSQLFGQVTRCAFMGIFNLCLVPSCPALRHSESFVCATTLSAHGRFINFIIVTVGFSGFSIRSSLSVRS
jgi:hypothetical protein